MEDKKIKNSKWLETIQSIFWVGFILVPIVTGLLAYHDLPNESPMLADGQVLKPYKILDSHEVCPDSGQCETVPDVWQNTVTGSINTKADFKSHRLSERNRMTTNDFLYGLIGCLFFAGVKYYKKEDFYKYFGMAVVVDMAFATYTFSSAYV